MGAEVEIIEKADWTAEGVLALMDSGKYDMMEEYVVQHPDIMALSPSGLNTVRVFTQLTGTGEVEILGARLRISINSKVDNMAAGNPAAPINLETGKIDGLAVFSDITRSPISEHPVTGVAIAGFQVPFWIDTLQMAKDLALFDTSNKSIGWDIAISETGPEVIEGNHNWCKLLWQLPVNQGLKSKLIQYK